MRLIHFHFGKDGGAERFFVNLVNSFHERGVEQSAFIRPRRVWRASIDPGVKIYEGTFRRISVTRFFMAARVRRLLRAAPPDGLMAWMPRASRFMPDWPHCLKIARLGDYPKRLDYFERIDVLVCNTPGIAERVRKLGWTKPVEVISNFTTVTASPPIKREAMNTPEHAFVVLAVGRFVERKGFHTLIEALSSLKHTYLWLVGDGEERERLITLAQKVSMTDRLRLVGWKPDIAPYFSACDVFCMPSSHEPLGNVILEAWSVGKPVVACRSEGPSWMMQDGVNGLLVDIGDVEGLSRAVLRLKKNPELMNAVAHGGRATLEAKFSKRSVTNAYLNLFSGNSQLPV